MIKKIYRLKQREVKKVLKKTKPFFSYNIVLNYSKNKFPYNRFAIIIGSKSVVDNVTRNFFRRRFYDFVRNSFLFDFDNFKETRYDFIFVVKKTIKLNKKNKKDLEKFEKDLLFLTKKFKNII